MLTHKNAAFSEKYYTRCFQDAGKIALSPFTSTWKGYLTTAAVVGTGLILFNNDKIITKNISSNYSKSNNAIAETFMLFGDKYFMGSVYIASYVTSIFTDDVRLRKTSLLAIESALFSAFITQSLKFLIHRHRPEDGEGPYVNDGASFKTEQLSFPSGHTTFAFSTAKIINECYSDKKYLPYITYPIATMAALSRVYDKKHWASDVLTGAAIGYFTASIIMNRYSDKTTEIYPIVADQNTYGLTLSYTF
ncbi:MAG: phosphatase PAP2 family protein [Candidatus Delongbacteria bacterium]|nr:phosphatase PAP2 family protein [Candidatus Delongbacteria bacterium]